MIKDAAEIFAGLSQQLFNVINDDEYFKLMNINACKKELEKPLQQ